MMLDPHKCQFLLTCNCEYFVLEKGPGLLSFYMRFMLKTSRIEELTPTNFIAHVHSTPIFQAAANLAELNFLGEDEPLRDPLQTASHSGRSKYHCARHGTISVFAGRAENCWDCRDFGGGGSASRSDKFTNSHHHDSMVFQPVNLRALQTCLHIFFCERDPRMIPMNTTKIVYTALASRFLLWFTARSTTNLVEWVNIVVKHTPKFTPVFQPGKLEVLSESFVRSLCRNLQTTLGIVGWQGLEGEMIGGASPSVCYLCKSFLSIFCTTSFWYDIGIAIAILYNML